MRKLLFLVFLLLYSLSILSYEKAGMGQWRTHFAYGNVTNITQSDNNVFAVATGALFSVSKSDDRLITQYNKITGLSDNVISYIEFDNDNKQLVIGYNNGNIDILAGNGVFNIPDYYNKIMSVNKNINHITIHNNKAYLSCNFGIVVLNLKKKEIAESYYIGANAAEVMVVNTVVDNDNIYALTYIDGKDSLQYKIYQASLSNPNLISYENWSTISNLPGNGHIQTLQAFSNSLFLLRDSILYYQQADKSWDRFKNISAYNISCSNNRMIINIDNEQTAFVDENFNITYKEGIGVFSDALYDNKNSSFWLGGLSQGLVYYKYDNLTTPILSRYIPNGPFLNTSWDLTFSGEKLYVVPGGRWGSQDLRPGCVMIFENNNWNNVTPWINAPVLDFMQTTVDPRDENHFFVTSYGTGLYEFRNNQLVNWYNAENTNGDLESAIPASPLYYTRLDGGVFDAAGNFWFTNTKAAYSVKVLTSKGKFIKLSCSGTDNHTTIGKIHIDKKNTNYKWILANRINPGIGILDDNGTIENINDDFSIFYRSFNDSDPNKQGERITPSIIYCITQEKSGTIWVGTNIGPILFQQPENALSGNLAATRIKIPRNDGSGLADLLLENEHIKSIAIDAANRKWLGTLSSGAFLVSEDGQETIQHFTTENSPLLSNDILSIAINSISGEVFFATANGLVSYQGDAAETANTFENVHVYPNPVKENFEGMITITGLLENTQIKITDLNGNLVCETRSNGSIATWNGKNFFGKRIGTGVYLALCVSEDGKQSTITKILVIN